MFFALFFYLMCSLIIQILSINNDGPIIELGNDQLKQISLKDINSKTIYIVSLNNISGTYTYDIQSPYLFTERLICAFANQCIPIYLGATEIDKFFNPDGIIKITQETDIKEVLKMCTPDEYDRRLPAILDNYERAKQYTNVWDFIYEKYLSKMSL